MKVALQSYATEWPVIFEYEKYLLQRVLQIPGIDIEHVGSTAVPGLSAKPVIDILVGMPQMHSLDDALEPMLSLGYVYVKYYERFIPDRRFLVRTSSQHMDKTNIIETEEEFLEWQTVEHTHHVHVVHYGSQYWNDHLKFRDHLRHNPADRLVYELLKKQLSDNDWESINDYVKAKTSFINMILTRP